MPSISYDIALSIDIACIILIFVIWTCNRYM